MHNLLSSGLQLASYFESKVNEGMGCSQVLQCGDQGIKMLLLMA